MKELKGKISLVTGGSRGIGRHILRATRARTQRGEHDGETGNEVAHGRIKWVA